MVSGACQGPQDSSSTDKSCPQIVAYFLSLTCQSLKVQVKEERLHDNCSLQDIPFFDPLYSLVTLQSDDDRCQKCHHIGAIPESHFR